MLRCKTCSIYNHITQEARKYNTLKYHLDFAQLTKIRLTYFFGVFTAFLRQILRLRRLKRKEGTPYGTQFYLTLSKKNICRQRLNCDQRSLNYRSFLKTSSCSPNSESSLFLCVIIPSLQCEEQQKHGRQTRLLNFGSYDEATNFAGTWKYLFRYQVFSFSHFMRICQEKQHLLMKAVALDPKIYKSTSVHD